jgi:hypothetical protein
MNEYTELRDTDLEMVSAGMDSLLGSKKTKTDPKDPYAKGNAADRNYYRAITGRNPR